MKKLFTKDRRTGLEKAIDNVLEEMSVLDPTHVRYKELLEILDALHKAKANDKGRRVSADTIAMIAGNLLIVGLILGYEKANVITSKAYSFIFKGRV